MNRVHSQADATRKHIGIDPVKRYPSRYHGIGTVSFSFKAKKRKHDMTRYETFRSSSSIIKCAVYDNIKIIIMCFDI